MGMSEGLAYGSQEPARNRSQPAYGDNRLSHEEPAEEKEHLYGRASSLSRWRSSCQWSLGTAQPDTPSIAPLVR